VESLHGPLREVMRTMRAMRRLSPEPVPDALLRQLVEAATWAPSGSNAQGYDYVVVTDRAKMAELADLWRCCVDTYLASVGRVAPSTMDADAYARMVGAIHYQRDNFADTPALVIPCYSSPRPSAATLGGFRGLRPRQLVRLAAASTRMTVLAEASSVYPGVQNLLLTARSLGLAANVTVWHLMLEREWKAALAIPRRTHTFAVIPIGWPLGKFGPVRRRPVEETIHRNTW
jgi:nitroreductase